MSDLAIVVPARLDSIRFPRKLLFEVRARPLILWTAENLRQIAGNTPLYFAVADPELEEVLTGEGYSCILTPSELPSGTDRIAFANRSIGASRVINVQADEPVILAEHIDKLIALLGEGMDMATLATPFSCERDFNDPNKVKVVVSPNQQALYFSRAPIPYDRDSAGRLNSASYWHLGLYAYTAELLKSFTEWPSGRLEEIERLEQLRVLENGGRIGVGFTQMRTIGIDVPDDVEELEAHLNGLEGQ